MTNVCCRRSFVAIFALLQAHRDAHQPRINKLSTGVQWEIARLISRGKISYTDLSSDCLSELMGSSADVAPNVPKYFRLRKQEASLSQEEILKQQRLMDTYERAYGHGGSAKVWLYDDRACN